MNALERTPATNAWRRLGSEIERPRAVLCISAHWQSEGTRYTASTQPETIHDFGGFPPELHAVRYPAPGDPSLGERVLELLAPTPVTADHEWGLDHGAWSILVHLYPQVDVPVVQLSLDARKSNREHYELGQRLRPLRDENVLILATGNVVHNLRRLAWGGAGADWAVRFESRVRELIEKGDHDRVIDFTNLGEDARLSVPTPDHFQPLLYVLGLVRPGDAISFPTTGIEHGSISMLSVKVE